MPLAPSTRWSREKRNRAAPPRQRQPSARSTPVSGRPVIPRRPSRSAGRAAPRGEIGQRYYRVAHHQQQGRGRRRVEPSDRHRARRQRHECGEAPAAGYDPPPGCRRRRHRGHLVPAPVVTDEPQLGQVATSICPTMKENEHSGQTTRGEGGSGGGGAEGGASAGPGAPPVSRTSLTDPHRAHR